ncbi:outer membrane protein assembly factor BamB family protein [Halosegnis longus]|uniref:outer membrane protein assembly factor BamB family protein n=1 Tax=Halosegnis longus TaxID=2216012 RepID=UPI00096A62E6|nr:MULTISPECIES: PQQ-binding-like beta-propeller repeat protein [Halobacteriales]
MGETVWEVTIGENVTSSRYFRDFDVVGVPSDSTYTILTAGDGTELLRVDTDTVAHRSKPLPDENLLLLSTGGETIAVDTQQWEVQWRSDGGTPEAIGEDRIVLADEATITGVNKASGRREWRETLSEDRIDVLCISQGTVVLSPGDWDDNTLIGIDAGSGRQRWRHVEDYWKSFEAYEDGVLVECKEWPDGDSYYSLTKINPVNGQEQWHVDEYLSLISGELIGDLFVSNGDRLSAVNTRTGRIVWANEYPSINNQFWLSEHEELFVSVQEPDYDEHRIKQIDPETGDTEWDLVVDDQIRGIERLNNQGLDNWIAGSWTYEQEDDSSFVYRLSSTYSMWQTNLPEEVNQFDATGSPVIGVGRNNTLYAFDEDDGTLEWTFSDERLNLISAGDESLVVLAAGERYLISREDGRIEEVFTDGSVASAEQGAIWTHDQTVEAYSLGTGSPLGDTSGGTTADSGDTQVYAGGDTGPDETNVYADDSGESTQASTTVDDTTISFCPSCGSNLDGFDSVAFCPSCGTEL